MATSDSIEKETTFTPGPWHVGTPHPQNACAYVIGANGEEIAVLYGADPAKQSVDGMWGPQPRRDATAAAMSATPELYAVVADFMENPNFRVAVGGNPNAVDELMARARNALAKARGEDRSHEGK